MTPAWTAEVVVSEDLARSLIESQFPQLAPARVEPLGQGFDNTAFRVNGTHVFRFPRRQVAVPWLEAEVRLLPAITHRLPLPIPIPTLVGVPAEGYPWPFAGYPVIPGRTACAANLDAAQRAAAAAPLARFLKALHSIPREEAIRLGAGADTIRRLDLPHRLSRARADLGRLRERGLGRDLRPFETILASATPDYTPRADTLVHGDLYARHLLVDETGRLAGVIDWGDIHVGDPAVDLAIAHTFLPPAAWPLFRESYGPIDEITWSVARLRALWHTTMVVLYAHAREDAHLLRAGLAAMDSLR